MANEKKFYAVITEVWDSTQFDEDEYIYYYEDKNLAKTEFENTKQEIISGFENWYDKDDDSIKIVITDGTMSDGERVCRITAKNGDDADVCVIKLKELKMICE